MKDKKFQDFPKADKQAWIDQATKDLKGDDFEKQLVSMAIEGFPVFPYYAVEDTKETQWIKTNDNRINPASDIPGNPPRYWTNAVEVAHEDPVVLNEEIKLVLQNGADGLILSLSEKTDLDTIFKDVLFPYISIWIKPTEKPYTSLKFFSDWLQLQGLEPNAIHGGVLWDGLAKGFQQPIQLDVQLDRIYNIHRLFEAFPNFRSICLDTTIYANSGGSSVQQIGYGLAALVELWDGLTERGAGAEELYSNLFIFTAVGSDYFMEIAKLKTLRIALSHLAELYHVNLPPEEVKLFSVSSKWNKSAQEPYNNLLRNTTEAMSAILGGCNVLFVEPHDKYSQVPDAFSKRMARNISNILKEEAHFDKVIDPAAGSYFVENLIEKLYTEAFTSLKAIEAEGGWWQAYANHLIQEDIRKMRRKKIARHAEERFRKPGPITEGIDQHEAFIEEGYQLRSISQESLLNHSL
ncbi:MAG TPA: methylmalonyl-CoA mutase family protein [Cyclobacteriaceae bacterium]|nr:methylmalonyl-CoA mutase family protein [Cyclobacteriaceae bacterium]